MLVAHQHDHRGVGRIEQDPTGGTAALERVVTVEHREDATSGGAAEHADRGGRVVGRHQGGTPATGRMVGGVRQPRDPVPVAGLVGPDRHRQVGGTVVDGHLQDQGPGQRPRRRAVADDTDHMTRREVDGQRDVGHQRQVVDLLDDLGGHGVAVGQVDHRCERRVDDTDGDPEGVGVIATPFPEPHR